MSFNTSIALAVRHAVAYITTPLKLQYPPSTVVELQVTLENNLTELYRPTWSLDDPSRGSSSRALRLSPRCLPPTAIYSACMATQVQWFDWIALLGGKEFDLCVDPGHVYLRYHNKAPGSSSSPIVTIWSEPRSARASAAPSPAPAVIAPPSSAHQSFGSAQHGFPQRQMNNKTLAQQLLEQEGQEDEELFALIADHVRTPVSRKTVSWLPTYYPPVTVAAAAAAHSSSPFTPAVEDPISSRSSSRSSSSDYSYVSSSSGGATSASGYSDTSVSATSSSSTPGDSAASSRRDRMRQSKVFVDRSKTQVTSYEGGRTTTLTGGVMLGGAAAGAPVRKPIMTTPTSTSWRGYGRV